jgi:hypothetical protein
VEDETRPIPVVLPSGHSFPPQATPDGDTIQSPELGGHTAAGTEAAVRAARAKLEQIRELYETAEGTGGDGLSRHSESVSQRPQDLIHDYFRRPQHASVDLSPDSGAADPDVNSRPT